MKAYIIKTKGNKMLNIVIMSLNYRQTNLDYIFYKKKDAIAFRKRYSSKGEKWRIERIDI